MKKISVIPVSYTHLDVYKRQLSTESKLQRDGLLADLEISFLSVIYHCTTATYNTHRPCDVSIPRLLHFLME